MTYQQAPSQPPTEQSNTTCLEVPPELVEQRFDAAAAKLFHQYSRSRLQQWIKSGDLTLNGETVSQRQTVALGDQLCLLAQPEVEVEAQPEPMALDVVFEDEDLLVLNKPAGLVVHPGAGNRFSTLLHGLLHHCPDLKHLPRAGIVHRLDKDTTGLMVVAKSLIAHTHLVKQLQARSVSREYWALAEGVMTGGGSIDANIGRHPKQRVKMAVMKRPQSGKQAITHYRVAQRFKAHTLVRCFLETGRTHQIRVHLAHLNYPLVGDPVYAGRQRIPAGISDELRQALQQFKRQALHAKRLSFVHPRTLDTLEFESELAADIQQLVALLQAEEAD